jgi:hypothetical protein
MKNKKDNPPQETKRREFCYEVVLYEVINGKRVEIERQQGPIDPDKFNLYGNYEDLNKSKNKYVST